MDQRFPEKVPKNQKSYCHGSTFKRLTAEQKPAPIYSYTKQLHSYTKQHIKKRYTIEKIHVIYMLNEYDITLFKIAKKIVFKDV